MGEGLLCVRHQEKFHRGSDTECVLAKHLLRWGPREPAGAEGAAVGTDSHRHEAAPLVGGGEELVERRQTKQEREEGPV